MKISTLAFFILITMNNFAQNPNVSSGKIIHFENFNSENINPRNVDVWLPDGYNTVEKYAVLYMHDGQMLFDSTTNWNKMEWGVDETAGRLISQQKIRKCIVVGIWNTSLRHMEYFPQKTLNYLSNDQITTLMNTTIGESETKLLPQDIISDNYLKFIVNELKPFIDSNYSTLSGQPDTFIAGSSMGGLISTYAICEYPEVFGGAACLSTHWPGTFTIKDNPFPAAFLIYLDDHLPSPENHKIYFDYGTETLDAWYEPYQLRADEIMKKKGFSAKSWITKKFPGENHSERSWNKRLDIPLVFLLGL